MNNRIIDQRFLKSDRNSEFVVRLIEYSNCISINRKEIERKKFGHASETRASRDGFIAFLFIPVPIAGFPSFLWQPAKERTKESSPLGKIS